MVTFRQSSQRFPVSISCSSLVNFLPHRIQLNRLRNFGGVIGYLKPSSFSRVHSCTHSCSCRFILLYLPIYVLDSSMRVDRLPYFFFRVLSRRIAANSRFSIRRKAAFSSQLLVMNAPQQGHFSIPLTVSVCIPLHRINAGFT